MLYVLEVVTDARRVLWVLEVVLCVLEAVERVLYVPEVVKGVRRVPYVSVVMRCVL